MSAENFPGMKDFLKNSGMFLNFERSVSSTLYGLNATKTGALLRRENISPGYTFVVRPQLNLEDYNLLPNPELMPLIANDGNDKVRTMWKYIRLLLDPRLASKNNAPTHPVLDPYNAFIPLFTNATLTLSGMPSRVVPTRETSPGLRKEQIVVPDGDRNVYNVFDIDITTQNFAGSPLDIMLEVWETWMTLNVEGKVMPYPDWMANLWLPYDTRIYRLVMSADLSTVVDISATGGSFPVNAEDGKKFDYNAKITYADNRKEDTTRFASSGAIYLKHKLIYSFNYTVAVFNRAMLEIHKGNEDGELVYVPLAYRRLLNYAMYPYIDPATHRLRWYTFRSRLTKKEREMIE